jgi:uncharacterized protein YndB with AHSA1/START domain
MKKDDSGRRWVEMDFLIPGTPEQVWQAIATGAGMSAWFTTTRVEERVGGAISFEFGGDDTSQGTVTEWDPPVRLAYEERDWNGDAPPLATEVTVTSRNGDQCVVRMVHTMITDRDDWDGELDSFESGWTGCFEVLRIYLRDFAGAQSAVVRTTATHHLAEATGWSKLTGALGLAGANAGDRRESPADTPGLAGRIERIHQDAKSREITARIDQPAPGVAVVGSCTVGQGADSRAMVMLSLYLYGEESAAVAAAEQQKWTEWLRGVVGGQPVTT